MEAHSKAAELHIPKKEEQKKRVPWENYNTVEKLKVLNECHKQTQERLTEVNEHYQQIAKHELDNAYNTEQENYINEKIQALEKAHANQKSRIAWTIDNEVPGRKKTNTGRVKATERTS